MDGGQARDGSSFGRGGGEERDGWSALATWVQ